LQARPVESLDDVSLRFAQSLTAGLAAFQIVVGQKLDLFPPGTPVEMLRGLLLGYRNAGEHRNRHKKAQIFSHGMPPDSLSEPKDNRRSCALQNSFECMIEPCRIGLRIDHKDGTTYDSAATQSAIE